MCIRDRGLSKPPRAIESYDISNWGDGSSVCGMVTFKDGKPFKAGYRKFKMKTVAGTDDYASLAETVSRRAAEYEKYAAQAESGQSSGNWFGQKPDLLLMDGGRGQVSAARQARAGTALEDVPLYGMVKDDHHRTRAMVDSDAWFSGDFTPPPWLPRLIQLDQWLREYGVRVVL